MNVKEVIDTYFADRTLFGYRPIREEYGRGWRINYRGELEEYQQLGLCDCGWSEDTTWKAFNTYLKDRKRYKEKLVELNDVSRMKWTV
jgi:hypothetical protein